jgi:hypothetical protein
VEKIVQAPQAKQIGERRGEKKENLINASYFDPDNGSVMYLRKLVKF